ncbi:MAG TPA: hypothetical protein VHK01_19875 [Lacipirellulaceae bacterium]|nr:hypothetical protein [Lacipirellulaceae bacterium]
MLNDVPQRHDVIFTISCRIGQQPANNSILAASNACRIGADRRWLDSIGVEPGGERPMNKDSIACPDIE